VKFHLHNIYEKLGVRGRVELVNFARQKKLI
jgi:DNA-binding CsgD family transcriptional regulator